MRHLLTCKNKETANWFISTFTKMGMTVEVLPSVGNYDLVVYGPSPKAKVTQSAKLTNTQGWVAVGVIALTIFSWFRCYYGV